jgi:predicted nucleotidyltransferase
MSIASASLEKIEPILVEFGQRHAAIQKLEVFGSMATGRADAESDLDVLVSLNADAPSSLKYFSFFSRLQEELQKMIDRKVDLVDRESLNQDAFSYNAVQGVKTVYERG